MVFWNHDWFMHLNSKVVNLIVFFFFFLFSLTNGSTSGFVRLRPHMMTDYPINNGCGFPRFLNMISLATYFSCRAQKFILSGLDIRSSKTREKHWANCLSLLFDLWTPHFGVADKHYLCTLDILWGYILNERRYCWCFEL